MIKKITHRLGWKILSVVLAFFLWLMVVNYEDPLTTRDFTLQVEKINESAITSQNKAIEYKDGLSVKVTVKGKRSIIDKLTESNVSAFADLSKISITGAVDIEVRVPEGVTVPIKTPTDMTIAMENIISTYKEVQYIFKGVPAEPYEALDPVISPNVVQITGPESQVNQVSSVIITLTVDKVKKDVTLLATPQLLDNSQKEVKNITTNVDHVSVKVPIEKTKEIPVAVGDANDLTEGYVITKQEQDIQSITIRGKEAIIDAISGINITDLSLASITESAIVSVDLSKYLPADVTIKNNDAYLNVSYTIAKLEEKTMSILSQDIAVKNIPDGLKFSYTNEGAVELTFKGIQADLDLLTLEYLNPYIRLYGLLPGEQQTPLFYAIPDRVTLISEPPVLNITLIETVQP